MTTVISKPHPHQVTIDAGNKALLRPTDEVKGCPKSEWKIRERSMDLGVKRRRQGFQTGRTRSNVPIEPGHEHERRPLLRWSWRTDRGCLADHGPLGPHTVKVGGLPSFLIIVAVFTRYIGTVPEIKSADGCRAHGFGALAHSH